MAMDLVEGEAIEKALGKRLQEARRAADLTQQELCQKAGLSYSTLAKIERGAIKAPSVFTIFQIATVLGTSLDTLMGMESAAVQAPPQRRRTKSGVQFVYFDINGCLVRFFHRAFNRIAEESGKPADVIETAFWHYNDAACRGEMSMEDFNRRLGAQLGMGIIDWAKYYLDAIDAIEPMHEMVVWSSQYYRVGLLSNIMPGLIDAMLERGLLPRIDYAAIIDSSVVSAIKPEPKIYEIAQEASKSDPHEILLIDDSRTNLMAAERAGWHVLWFDDYRLEESVARVRAALEPTEQ